MAMSQAEQRAAAERILKKHPMTPEETARFKMLTKSVYEYDVPREKRSCGLCGAKFGDTVDGKGEIQVSALEKFSDHQAQHNPTGAQWTQAYNQIRSKQQAAT